MSAWIPFIVGIFVLALALITPFVIPKGPNSDVIKVSVAMTFICCYLMWAITYIAQLNPLVAPILRTAGAGH